MKVVFGSRGSELALAQTKMVMARLTEIHPSLELELQIIKTTGDNKPEARLEEIGGLGAFTREIELALLNGEIDVAVHSLKDLPTKQPEGLVVAAIAGRESPNDVLITKTGNTLTNLKEKAVVGTSSLRRQSQLLSLRPDLEIRDLRGNVPIRMKRVADGDLDAVILAAAGLRRLGLENAPGVWEIPISVMLPAPGQGALALETRIADNPLRQLLEPLHDREAAVAVQCERAVLQAFGGGCRAPLGVYARIQGDAISVQAFAANMETGKTVHLSREAGVADAISLGEEIGKTLQTTGSCLPESSVCRTEPIRVVITRAPHQTTSFGKVLEQAGAQVLYLPLIDIEPVQDVNLPDVAEDFDWLVFTSANATIYFQRMLQHYGRDITDYSGAKVAAIGNATASVVESYGLHVDCIPERHVAESLAKALLQQEPNTKGKRVLLPQGNLARPAVAEGLKEHGMHVSPLVVYKTAPRNLTYDDMETVINFAPHCISFFSPSAVQSYLASGLQDRLGAKIVYASIGPVTSEALHEASCVPVVESKRQSEDSLRDAIIEVCCNG